MKGFDHYLYEGLSTKQLFQNNKKSNLKMQLAGVCRIIQHLCGIQDFSVKSGICGI